MRRGLTQQALAVLIVSLVIIVTLVGGVILVLAESATASTTPTPTLYHIPTLGLPTAVGEATHTATPTPEATAAVIPTSLPATTAAPTTPPTVTRTPTAATCQIAAGWVAYSIQPGDTLFLIGLRYGVTVTTMLAANCLTTTLIHAGDVIYVPPVTPIPLTPGQDSATVDPPADPVATGTVSATDGICTNPDSIIITPKVGAVLTGMTDITGTARVPDFAFYKIDIRQEGTQQPYVTFYTGHEQITSGVLAELNTATWPNGEYWLRLVVVNSISNYPEPCAILVVFLN